MTVLLTNRNPSHQPFRLQEASVPPALAQSNFICRKIVVVQSGARDAYQLALALAERNALEALVTDLFWPADRPWAEALQNLLPAGLRSLLLQRSNPRIPWSRIKLCLISGIATIALDKLPKIPLSVRRRITRYNDSRLGTTAGHIASETNAGLVSYSYYGYDAFNRYGRPGILFQLHPHPATMRRLLMEELKAHPDCASSLAQEWELSLPERDFQHLVRETKMASGFLVASSFTKKTLVEHGADPKSVRVVPYGVDSLRFTPQPRLRSPIGSKLQLLFVGRIGQRKGVKYLLEAVRAFSGDEIELTVCGRVVDSLELFRPFASQVKIRPSVSAADLVAAYQAADLFVFPSIAEGFGQVLLESMACGLPILSTTHTAAPDLIEHGVQGFVVEPRRADLIAEHIQWALTHRAELLEMGYASRCRAESFSWERFRAGAASAIEDLFSTSAEKFISERHHV